MTAKGRKAVIGLQALTDCNQPKADTKKQRVPYSDERELLGDILRFGAEVQVIAPNSLKKRMQDEAKRLQSLYKA